METGEIKDYWYINAVGDVIRAVYKTDDLTRLLIAIGNYFETPEEAEKAVEKLEAWKRLKDNGFKFDGYHIPAGEIQFNMTIQKEVMDEFIKDMDICFGGEQ